MAIRLLSTLTLNGTHNDCAQRFTSEVPLSRGQCTTHVHVTPIIVEAVITVRRLYQYMCTKHKTIVDITNDQ